MSQRKRDIQARADEGAAKALRSLAESSADELTAEALIRGARALEYQAKQCRSIWTCVRCGNDQVFSTCNTAGCSGSLEETRRLGERPWGSGS